MVTADFKSFSAAFWFLTDVYSDSLVILIFTLMLTLFNHSKLGDVSCYNFSLSQCHV